jgi:hypothetical protein
MALAARPASESKIKLAGTKLAIGILDADEKCTVLSTDECAFVPCSLAGQRRVTSGIIANGASESIADGLVGSHGTSAGTGAAATARRSLCGGLCGRTLCRKLDASLSREDQGHENEDHDQARNLNLAARVTRAE